MAKALLLLLLSTGTALATSTINSADRHAYAANLGWIDWRGDGNNGGVIGEFTCLGFIYSANAGWINLGSGAPINGIRYGNQAAGDFGVNHDGAGNLHGMAWGANIGWINFTNRDATGASLPGPKVDLVTGVLSGHAYGANVGWISLSNLHAFVRTDSLRRGPDSDGDGLPDDWERQMAGNLTTLDGSGDPDHDGLNNAAEYIADTHPLDTNSGLRITQFLAAASGTSDTITWSSRPTRLYRLQERSDLNPGFPWSASDLIAPDAGASTTRTFTDDLAPRRFFRIEAVYPLSP